ncbi:MAG: hypothetical protein AAF387_21540 [Pseudomonadota bacterium]
MLKPNLNRRLYPRCHLVLTEVTTQSTVRDSFAAMQATRAIRVHLGTEFKQAPSRQSPQRLNLKISIVDAEMGCHLTRSSPLFALLGFGNAKLRLFAEVTSHPNLEPVWAANYCFQHAGLNIPSSQYLEDNGQALIGELALKACEKIAVRLRRHLILKSLWHRLISTIRPIQSEV